MVQEFALLRTCPDNDKIRINPNIHRCEWLHATLLNIKISTLKNAVLQRKSIFIFPVNIRTNPACKDASTLLITIQT